MESFPVNDALVLHDGDMLSLESGRVDLGASGVDGLLGAAIEATAGGGATAFVRVITDADAVYGVADNHARSEGDALVLSGASGAQRVGEGSSGDLSVVATCSAAEETLVRIRPGRHAHDRPTAGELNTAIARAVVRTYRDYAGRGPNKAQAFFRHNIVVVMLQGVMTAAERSLAASGRTAAALEVRQQLQRTMRQDLMEAVARLTGCGVIAHMNASHSDPDIAAELFVLDRPIRTAGQESDSRPSG